MAPSRPLVYPPLGMIAVTTLRRFLNRPPRDRRLLVRAASSLALVRIGLLVLSPSRIRAWIERPRPRRLAPVEPPDRIAWAIGVASRRFPGTASCLPRAIAAAWMLAREGHPAVLRIGVRKSASGALEAHAWVESEGEAVIGFEDAEGYTPLLGIETEGSRR